MPKVLIVSFLIISNSFAFSQDINLKGVYCLENIATNGGACYTFNADKILSTYLAWIYLRTLTVKEISELKENY